MLLKLREDLKFFHHFHRNSLFTVLSLLIVMLSIMPAATASLCRTPLRLLSSASLLPQLLLTHQMERPQLLSPLTSLTMSLV